MRSITRLRCKINRLLEKIDTRIKPKTWHFIVECGKQLPAHIRALIAPWDKVIIRQCFAGWLDIASGYKLVKVR